MRVFTFSRFLIFATLLCSLHGAWAFHTIPCDNKTIQSAINSIIAEEKNNGGADGVDFYIALGGGLVFNEPVVINDTGVPGGVVIGLVGGLAIDPTDPNQCASSPGVFDGSQTEISGGGRFHQSVIQVTGHATVSLYGLILAGANLGGSGGGVSFDGTGSLDLYGVDIESNTAGSGAGIHANGSAPGLDVIFHDLVVPSGAHIIDFVQDNTATNGPGGGMDVSGETFLFANDGELIVGSNSATGDGGGIAFRGRGLIQLGQNAQLVGNSANNGGGIFVNPTDPTDVFFFDGVIVAGNTAQNAGGGIYAGNSTNLHADATVTPTLVFANKVTGNAGCGGGVFVGGPAQMTLTGAVTFNDSAGNGGGICGMAGTGTGDDDVDAVRISLTGRGPASPAIVSNNSATNLGGGIYCRGFSAGSVFGADTLNSCHLLANRFAIDANSAADGTAFFGKAESDSVADGDWGVDVNLGGFCGGQAGCNEISGNVRAFGSTQDGSTFVIPIWSGFVASNAKIQRNQGRHLIVTDSGSVTLALSTALVTDNQTDSTLIDAADSGAGVSVRDTTFAHNNLAATTVVRSPNAVFKNTIVDEEVDTFDFVGNDSQHDLEDILINPLDTTAAPALGTILHGRPTFVDAANGDYHLAAYSLGIDVAPADTSHPSDLDGNARDIDEALIDNADGPRDLGAFEFNGVLTPRFCSASDEIFCSQFE